MSHKSDYCIANTHEQADRLVPHLNDARFTHDDISVLVSDKATTHEFPHEKNTMVPEGAVTGATTGGSLVGAATGGLTSGLIRTGISDLEANRFEGTMQAGNILISIHTENTAEIEQAQQIAEQAGAEDICTTRESNNPKTPRADVPYDEPALTTARL